jgi:hypothetical protein
MRATIVRWPEKYLLGGNYRQEEEPSKAPFFVARPLVSDFLKMSVM